MAQGYDKDSDMWLNDPQVCRDKDPNWDDKIERNMFGRDMRNGIKPNDAYRDEATRQRYIAFLAENGSPLVNG
jgi:hypothetical protein